MRYIKVGNLSIALLLGLCIIRGAFAGVWLNLEGDNGIDPQALNPKLNWLDQQNDLNPNIDPWVGMRLYLTWGEIPFTGDKNDPNTIRYDFSSIVELLNAAYYRGDNRSYKLALTVSDKLWIFQHNGSYKYQPGALPRFYAQSLGGGDWANSGVIPDGSTKLILAHEDENGDGVSDNLRFAVANSHSNNTAARKYSVVRWNEHIRNLWYDFWYQFANYSYNEQGVEKKLKDHPALHGIITPESSLSGITHNNNELSEIGYVGADAYAELMLVQAKVLNDYFSTLPIISSINWISEDTTSRPAPYYQKYLGNSLSAMNQTSDTYGWFAQDLRLDGHMGKSSYENNVYPEFVKFSKSLRYAMITGDTYNNSHFSSTSNEGKARELVDLANSIGVGELLFLNQEQGQGPGINSEIFSLIAAADYSDYSFLPDEEPRLLNAVVYEGSHADRIALTLSEAVKNVSASDFTVSVDGSERSILQVQPHPTDAAKIWITLAARIYSGEEVGLVYGGNGTVIDSDGNHLIAASLEVSNRTTTVYDPAPSMQGAVVYEGSHANRIAVTLSESVNNISAAGFTLRVDGGTALISGVEIHPTDTTKIWITLAARIYSGEVVEVAYSGKGTITDSSGNGLAAGRITVTNRTTGVYDPAPAMLSAVVYKGTHAERIAVILSEAVEHVSATGFSVKVNGRKQSILSVSRHPTDAAKLWVTLSDQVKPGDDVVLQYSGRGTLEDSAGNGMDAGVVNVNNAT